MTSIALMHNMQQVAQIRTKSMCRQNEIYPAEETSNQQVTYTDRKIDIEATNLDKSSNI
jgi:hypothetical protein